MKIKMNKKTTLFLDQLLLLYDYFQLQDLDDLHKKLLVNKRYAASFYSADNTTYHQLQEYLGQGLNLKGVWYPGDADLSVENWVVQVLQEVGGSVSVKELCERTLIEKTVSPQRLENYLIQYFKNQTSPAFIMASGGSSENCIYRIVKFHYSGWSLLEKSFSCFQSEISGNFIALS
jgi:hypothetical protein